MIESPGYIASKEALLKRLARAEGQIRGVAGMVEAGRYCIDIITQIQAAQAALDKVALGLLDDHARNCMDSPASTEEREQQVAEMMGAVGRLMHR